MSSNSDARYSTPIDAHWQKVQQKKRKAGRRWHTCIPPMQAVAHEPNCGTLKVFPYFNVQVVP